MGYNILQKLMNMVPVTIDTCMQMATKFSRTYTQQVPPGVHLAVERSHVAVDRLVAVLDFTHAMKCPMDIVISAVRILEHG